ncbi:transcriptional regulator, LytR family protein [Mycobacterium uberis]|uniref:Transcriptional regulator, LytR family protein n=1 Tax=Mycobacterium uberis TaxID=2162698 RepID=A0A3E1HHT1_9MYCO|nr:LCP family protein [Mycobacterium uberis]RFD26011.1 transcriptional regulator, LytR family protein [Mycobacterium uberis]
MARSDSPRHRHRAVRKPSRIRIVLTRGFMTLTSLVAVLLTGAGYWTAHGALGGITVSQALTADDPRSTDNHINILLIGLDSRKDQQGNDLPWSILKQLHAGDSDDGGYNTNTLILVHVGTNNKAVAFSIPRDDWVPFSGVPGYHHIKIKEAYGLTKQYVAQKLADQGVDDQKELETQGREAARAATLRAVRSLTGVPIDYFAEINLAGFYDLAQTLGGVEVCLNHTVYDSYSGADFPAGQQRLDASEALAFVRQRHGLDNGDLDRTHRQQAFISSVMRELRDTGTFTNLDKLKSLMAVARKDVVLSAGWNEDLIQRLGVLANGSGENRVEFRTLPVVRYDNIDGQDVNIIDPAAIKAEVASAIGAAPPVTTTTTPSKPNPSIVVDVINAGSLTGLASEVSRALEKHGYTTGQIRDRNLGEPATASIQYGAGADTDAQNVATLLDIDAPTQADPKLASGHIRVIVDTNYSLPAADNSTSNETTTTSKKTSTYPSYNYDTSPYPTPDQGQPIDGDGVPCVN